MNFFGPPVVLPGMKLGTTVGPYPDRIDAVPHQFSFVELSVGEGEIPPKSVDDESLRADLSARDLGMTVHLPFRQPLVTAVEGFNAAQREYLASLLDSAARWGASKAVVHATVRNPRAGREAVADEAIRRQLRRVADLGAARDVEVCFENVGNLRGGIDLSRVGRPVEDVGGSVCFDVGHAFEEGCPEGIETFLDAYGDLVSHLHVHDARRRGDSHIPVGSGQIDFEAVGDRLAGFPGTAAFEVFTDDPDYLALSAEKFAACL